MKKISLFLSLSSFFVAFGQIPAYYSGVDFSLTELELKSDLADLVTSTHTSPTTYDEVWAVLQNADLDPTNSALVLLMYGYNDVDGDITNDRSRDKTNYGGATGQWNREHVFPKSLGSPDLGTTGPGSDPHNLRASDVQMNGARGNKKFATGSGNAGSVGSNWYPGDEWKGDAARIIMYMYVRYGNRCLPSAVAVGTVNAIDAGMIDLLLEWNAEDDVSSFEINRNNAIYAAIGNRNPFIDNPHIANHIWYGAEATDTWGSLGNNLTASVAALQTFPNPVIGNTFFITAHAAEIIEGLHIYNLQGQEVTFLSSTVSNNLYAIDLSLTSAGVYLLQFQLGDAIETRKIILQ